ncbi:hypothetical protein HYQ46_000071 [Verticillium longisporum]|nr:hypothetical protein HYQ46_000071 [Verticillium longisporum]
MHQPRPQKTVSVAGIESPTLDQQPFHQAFHQQVPPQVSNGLGPDGHSRQPSYPSHLSTGTPLSHIPERAIHAAPFQPTHYGQQNYYGHQQSYGMMPQQPGYYQPPAYNGGVMPSPASAVPFIPASQQAQSQNYPQQSQYEQHGPGGNPGMVAQEVNGMVYYYDASQMPPSNNYQGYQGPPVYGSGVPGMAGMVAPSPDGFFYPQQAPGMGRDERCRPKIKTDRDEGAVEECCYFIPGSTTAIGFSSELGGLDDGRVLSDLRCLTDEGRFGL